MTPLSTYRLRAICLRPYQLLCLVCRLGERQADEAARARFAVLNKAPFWTRKHAFLDQVLETICRHPDTPVVLRCNELGAFAYQDPGTDDDSPEGAEYNRRRDLDVLRALNLVPGAAMPARALFYRMQNHVPTVNGICGYETCTAHEWAGCPKAGAGFYERGRGIDIDTYIPVRTDEERAEAKTQSLATMRTGDVVRIRPHLLMCAVCQYGMGIRPPFDADNLPEFIALVLAAPETRVMLAQGADGMMCAPCKRRVDATGACVNVSGTGGLSNELRDLTVLQLLGLGYGNTLPAGALFRRLFERIPSSVAVCTKDHARTSAWWDCCGDEQGGNACYVKGREALQELGLG